MQLTTLRAGAMILLGVLLMEISFTLPTANVARQRAAARANTPGATIGASRIGGVRVNSSEQRAKDRLVGAVHGRRSARTPM